MFTSYPLEYFQNIVKGHPHVMSDMCSHFKIMFSNHVNYGMSFFLKCLKGVSESLDSWLVASLPIHCQKNVRDFYFYSISIKVD